MKNIHIFIFQRWCIFRCPLLVHFGCPLTVNYCDAEQTGIRNVVQYMPDTSDDQLKKNKKQFLEIYHKEKRQT